MASGSMSSGSAIDSQASLAILETLPQWLEPLAGLGCWTIEHASGATLMEAAIRCSRHALRLLGQEARPPATVADLIALCHGDDQQTLRGLLQRLVISDLGRRGACCCRLGEVSPSRSIRLDVELLGGADGPLLVGTVRDAYGAPRLAWLRPLANRSSPMLWP